MRLTLAAALAACLAVPAMAQNAPEHPPPGFVFTPSPPGGALVGTITWGNAGEVPGEYFHDFETAEGVVTLRHVVTTNGGRGCCPDTVEVMQTPPGILVRPMSLEMDEEHHTTFDVIRWTGG